MQNNTIRVGMLILLENDLEKAVEFYKKMGLPVSFHLEGKWAELAIDTIKLGLCPTDQELPDRHTGVILEVDDIHHTYTAFKDLGIEFIREPFEAIHGIMASMKDPGGNIIDLYQPTPDKVREMVEKIKQEETNKESK
jgi:predicted enzyme related to lactoylglutathione lyase